MHCGQTASPSAGGRGSTRVHAVRGSSHCFCAPIQPSRPQELVSRKSSRIVWYFGKSLGETFKGHIALKLGSRNCCLNTRGCADRRARGGGPSSAPRGASGSWARAAGEEGRGLSGRQNGVRKHKEQMAVGLGFHRWCALSVSHETFMSEHSQGAASAWRPKC